MFEGIRSGLVPRIIRGLLRSGFAMELAKGGAKWSYRRENRAFGLWLDFLFDTMKMGFSKERPVVWISAFTPSEIPYAFDLNPILPEVIASLAAHLGVSEHTISIAERNLYSTDLCSFYRCGAGLALGGYLPKPDLIISTSHLCDGAHRFFHNMGRLFGCDHYLIDVPYGNDGRAHTYLVDELNDLADFVGKRTGHHLDEERAAEVLELSNRTRRVMLEINELRRRVPSPFSGSEGMSYVLGMSFSTLGSKVGLAFFRALHGVIRERVNRAEGVVGEEKYRLLWLHHIRPYYPNTIFDILGGLGAVVSFEEANHIYWEPMDPKHPLEGLASKMLSNFGCGPIEHRIEAISEMARKYRVDGTIHFSHWGCRQSCGGSHMIRDVMRERGVPALVLDGDGVDVRNYSEGQTMTRLEAFIEMLG
jgi:benzoyl-CoA reductase/2-hydroxyglutaryl-CoA dehydratase subunit BcrC/BadD/HgdB